MQTANSPQLECRGGMQTYQCADITERSDATLEEFIPLMAHFEGK